MRITHKQDTSKHPYHLSNTELKSVNSCKDLGVYVSRDLSWSNQADAIVNKANKVVGPLKRTVSRKKREIFSMLCKSLVGPILEYACPVWSPYLVKDHSQPQCLRVISLLYSGSRLVKDKLAVEKVQRRASRIVLSQKLREMSYEERCMYIAQLEHTSAQKRIPICSGMLQDSIWSKWPRL